ncbi:hypothetical protein DRH13_01785 [Candidatus Woesebacteria bacterium]|nr:MAG: hypothetical protein DRH13_01785 [Candidatus Woesebacteria bacterium]
MGKATVTYLDAVHCKANKEARKLIIPALAYENTAWRRNRRGTRTAQTNTSHLITGRVGTGGTFLAGLDQLVIEYCKKEDKKVVFKDRENIEYIKATAKPYLEGIKFRPDQKRALRIIKKKSRGRIIFPTGSGKTIIALGIMSMFPDCRVLFLCHTKDLINQTLIELRKYFKDRAIFVIGAGYKSNMNEVKLGKNPILLSTIQSFSNIQTKDYIDFFDITIVDEGHHANSRKSQYGKVMEHNLSPRRYALTATIPTKRKEVLINEGFFGKTIVELTVSKGIKIGIIAKPIIQLIPVPYSSDLNIRCERKYKNFYQHGIVENTARNAIIVNEVKKSIKKKETTLIIIERTDHGHLLQKMLEYKGVKAPFVQGSTSLKERNRVKRQLKIKKKKVVICSKVWKEGINIPSLNHIINACGMKEEKAVIQAMGRGLRTTKNKKTIKLTDFLDPYMYLAQHAILRIQVYYRQGWM